MPKGAVSEATNYAIPEETLCPAKLQSVEAVTVKFTYKKGPKAGQDGSFDKWVWTFGIYEGPYAGLTVEGSTEDKITNGMEQSGSLKLARPWYEVLLGRELRLGEEIDTDNLLGLACQITVRHEEPRPKKDGEGFWFNIAVEDVFPAKKNADGTVAYDEPPF